MLTQEKADSLIKELKHRVEKEIFSWSSDISKDELIVAVNDNKLQFVLSLKRNPFEIRLHFRTKDQDIGLLRVDDAPYHPNPDGEEIRGPHLHYYVEGSGLAYAKLIDWYDCSKPEDTLYRFLEEINTEKFPIQMDLF